MTGGDGQGYLFQLLAVAFDGPFNVWPQAHGQGDGDIVSAYPDYEKRIVWLPCPWRLCGF